MSIVARELVTKIGFNVDDTKLKKIENAVTNLKTNLNGLSNFAFKVSAAFTGAFTGLTTLAIDTANNINNLNAKAQNLSTTANNLNELNILVQQAGSKVNAFNKSFTTFNKKLQGVSNASIKSTKEFKQLGISITDNNGNLKDGSDLYIEAAQKLNNLGSSTKRAQIGQKLFGNSANEFIKIFGQSNDAIVKQRNEIRLLNDTISNKAIKASKDFTKSWSSFKAIINNVKQNIAFSFMPVFNEMASKLQSWYLINKDIINQKINSFVTAVGGSFIFLGEILKKTFPVINALLSPIKLLVNLLGGYKNTIRILGSAILVSFVPSILAATSAFVALSAAILSNPLTWFLGLIGLATDDIYHWAAGNKSVTGVVLGSWNDFKVKIKDIFNEIKGFAKSTTDSIKEYFENSFVSIFKKVKEIFGSAFTNDQELYSFSKFKELNQAKQLKVTTIDNAANISLEGIDLLNDDINKELQNFKKATNDQELYSFSKFKELNQAKQLKVTIDDNAASPKIIDLVIENISRVLQSFKNKFTSFDEFKELNQTKQLKLTSVDNKGNIKHEKVPNSFDRNADDINGAETIQLYEIEKNYNEIIERVHEPIIKLPTLVQAPLDISDLHLPMINPSNESGSTNTSNFNNKFSTNNNITINVPEGTNAEQSRSIAEQVSTQVQEIFDTNILRALDSMSEL